MTTAQDDIELLATVRSVFEEKIPFVRALGLTITRLDMEKVVVSFDFREDLVGNFIRGALHGGVISSALDTTGGLVAFIGVLKRVQTDSAAAKIARLANIGTIDLRIDYLRSGVGRSFHASGAVLRAGNKVVVTRMELHNNEQTLLAVGTGTYLVG